MVKVSFASTQCSGASRGLEEGISSVIERWRNGDVDVWESRREVNNQGVNVQEEEKETEPTQVGKNVWETTSFTEWRPANWACFDNFFDDKFYDLPGKKFRNRVDPRSARKGILKPGYRWMTSIDADDVEDGEGEDEARAAVDFYNRKKGLDSIRFEKLVGYVNRCVVKGCPMFFVTFDAIDNFIGAKKTFQASVVRGCPDPKKSILVSREGGRQGVSQKNFVLQGEPVYRVRAFRTKP